MIEQVFQINIRMQHQSENGIDETLARKLIMSQLSLPSPLHSNAEFTIQHCREDQKETGIVLSDLNGNTYIEPGRTDRT